MRFSFYTIMLLSALALSGAAFAQTAQKTVAQKSTTENTPIAPAPIARAPLINPMGAGLLVPAGEAASPIAERDGIAIRTEPRADAPQIGILQAEGSDNPYQMHVIIKRTIDPNWQPSWWKKLLGRTAPVIEKQTPVSEFTLSPAQKAVMIVKVEGNWLQIGQGWFEWSEAIAKASAFKPWSELYQEGSFSAFQLTNARANKADIVPLGKVSFTEDGGARTDATAPTRFIVLDAAAGALKLRATSGTCGAAPKAALEGVVGWVNLFAKNGAPQLLLQAETCPTDTQTIKNN